MIRILAMTAIAAGALLAAPAASAQTRPAAPARPANAAPAQPQADEATRTFRAWDKNGDGQLSLQEFQQGFRQTQEALQTVRNLRRQFATIDANHNSAVDPNEYGNLLLIKQAGRNAPPLSRFDANGNGKLEFNEYLKLVEALAPKAQGQTPAAGQNRR